MSYHARYTVILDASDRLAIRDEGPWDTFLTVTNDAEHVVEELRERLGNRSLFYIDSNGEVSQLLIRNGKFDGFAIKNKI